MNLIGLDISGQRTIGVVVDEHGTVVRRVRRDTPDGRDGSRSPVLRELAAGFSIAAVGAATEVAADVASLHVDNLPKPLHVGPGAAAVMAEAWVGAAQGVQHAVCLKIGERVLAGILLNAKPWTAAHGLAGAAA